MAVTNMSLFSEQNAILLAGLNNAKAAIEGKGGSVVVANSTPRIAEVVAGIGTIVVGGGTPSESATDIISLASNAGITARKNNKAKITTVVVMNDTITTTLT